MQRKLYFLWMAAGATGLIIGGPNKLSGLEQDAATEIIDKVVWVEEEYGLDWFANFTAEAWGNAAGGGRRGVVTNYLFEFGAELDLQQAIGWSGASVHVSWVAPLGPNLSEEYTHNLFTVSNIAAYNSLYLYEAWLQQNFMDGQISTRLGQLAADSEFIGSDYNDFFLNGTFGWPAFMAENIPNAGPAFPKGVPAVRLAIVPASWLTLRTAVYQGGPFADEVNRYGVRWKLNSDAGVLWLNEVELRWNQDTRQQLLGAGQAWLLILFYRV